MHRRLLKNMITLENRKQIIEDTLHVYSVENMMTLNRHTPLVIRQNVTIYRAGTLSGIRLV